VSQATGQRQPAGRRARGGLLASAGLVARREYLERVRSRAFVISTVILAVIAVLLALLPLGIRYAERHTVVRVEVYADDAALAVRSVGVLDALLNRPPAGADAESWDPDFAITTTEDLERGLAAVEAGSLDGLLVAERRADGSLEFTLHARDGGGSVQTQLLNFAALGIAILEWTAALPPDSAIGPFVAPGFTVVNPGGPTDGGAPLDPQEMAGRIILGTFFVVLIFITLLTYGMWVATSVASEKSSRVMELLVGAATPAQLLVGKVAGVGSAGLTQYVVILIPAIIVLLLQEPIGEAVLGLPADQAGTALSSLSAALLIAYGVYFLLGFALYAFLYAAAGSLVSRMEDVQQLALPMGLLSMAGYLVTVLSLSAADSDWLVAFSFIPFFSPFAMLARLIVGQVAAWEVALSLAILVVSIILVAAVAARVYRVGVLLYGQRAGLRLFVRALRTEH
jgi:ABC-2 type transport system permease protein